MKDYIVIDGVTYDLNMGLAAFLRKPIAKSHVKYSMENGDVYASSIRVEDVASDGTLKVLLSNPADSVKNICWCALVAASEGKAYLDMYGQVVVDTPGTAMFQTQKFAGSPNTSVADTEYDGVYTYSAANLIYQGLISGGFFVGGELTDAELAMAIPGKSVLVVLTNKETGTKDMSIRIIWIDCETVGV